MRKLPLFLVLAAASMSAQWNPPNPVVGVEQQRDGVLFRMQSGAMRIQVCSDSILRVLYSPTSAFPERPDYVIAKTRRNSLHLRALQKTFCLWVFTD